jgi:hypothetical protein
MFAIRKDPSIAQEGTPVAYPIDDDSEFPSFDSEESVPTLYPMSDYKSGNTQLELHVRNASSYMVNAIVKTFLKKHPCVRCNEMFEHLVHDNGSHEPDSELTINKAYNTSVANNCTDITSYGWILKPAVANPLIDVCKSFEITANEALDTDGCKILRTICDNVSKCDAINSWLTEDEGICLTHREKMLSKLVTSLINRLVKDKNENVKQSKSWSQTRINLRNQ